MANTPLGKKLTEQHRLDQARLKAEFLALFIDKWPMLNPYDLDRTAPAWVLAVEPIIDAFRERSAQLTEDYYAAFRAAESPEAALEGPPPVITREQPETFKAPRSRATNPRIRQNRSNVRKPRIEWGDEKKRTRTSLMVTGPANVKSKRGRGKSPEEAHREAVVDAGGSAARHVLTGGRDTHLELVDNDPAEPIGWMRVTDGDPCWFCAMLASRGPRYRSEKSATRVVKPKRKRRGSSRRVGDTYHDNCACVAEPMFSRSQAWPGKGREWQNLWNEVAKGLSGDEARKAFRREYEYRQRKANRISA